MKPEKRRTERVSLSLFLSLSLSLSLSVMITIRCRTLRFTYSGSFINLAQRYDARPIEFSASAHVDENFTG